MNNENSAEHSNETPKPTDALVVWAALVVVLLGPVSLSYGLITKKGRSMGLIPHIFAAIGTLIWLLVLLKVTGYV